MEHSFEIYDFNVLILTYLLLDALNKSKRFRFIYELLYLLNFVDPNQVFQKVIYYLFKNLLKTYVKIGKISIQEICEVTEMT